MEPGLSTLPDLITDRNTGIPLNARYRIDETINSTEAREIGRSRHHEIGGRCYQAIDADENIVAIACGRSFPSTFAGNGISLCSCRPAGILGPSGSLHGFVGQLSQFPALHR